MDSDGGPPDDQDWSPDRRDDWIFELPGGARQRQEQANRELRQRATENLTDSGDGPKRRHETGPELDVRAERLRRTRTADAINPPEKAPGDGAESAWGAFDAGAEEGSIIDAMRAWVERSRARTDATRGVEHVAEPRPFPTVARSAKPSAKTSSVEEPDGWEPAPDLAALLPKSSFDDLVEERPVGDFGGDDGTPDLGRGLIVERLLGAEPVPPTRAKAVPTASMLADSPPEDDEARQIRERLASLSGRTAQPSNPETPTTTPASPATIAPPTFESEPEIDWVTEERQPVPAVPEAQDPAPERDPNPVTVAFLAMGQEPGEGSVAPDVPGRAEPGDFARGPAVGWAAASPAAPGFGDTGTEAPETQGATPAAPGEPLQAGDGDAFEADLVAAGENLPPIAASPALAAFSEPTSASPAGKQPPPTSSGDLWEISAALFDDETDQASDPAASPTAHEEAVAGSLAGVARAAAGAEVAAQASFVADAPSTPPPAGADRSEAATVPAEPLWHDDGSQLEQDVVWRAFKAHAAAAELGDDDDPYLDKESLDDLLGSGGDDLVAEVEMTPATGETPFGRRAAPESWGETYTQPVKPVGQDASIYRPPMAERRTPVAAVAVPNPSQHRRTRRRHLVRGMVETVLLALIVFLCVRATFQNFRVEGSSMYPTLEDGEFLIVNKLSFTQVNTGKLSGFLPFLEGDDGDQRFVFGGPERGDIVVLQDPRRPEQDLIKRVIGLPGETVEIRDGRVYIDDMLLNEPYIKQEWHDTRPKVTIPEGQYYVLGDNRDNSLDSRSPQVGLIPLDLMVGKASLTYWPFDKLGLAPNGGTSLEEPTLTTTRIGQPAPQAAAAGP